MRAWEEFVRKQENELGKHIVDKWLSPLKVVRFDACNLYLEAPDSFFTVWFDEHIRHRTNQHLLNNNNKPIKVHLTLKSAPSDSEKDKTKRRFSSSIFNQQFELHFDEIDAKNTFKNFITAKSNLLGYKLLTESCGYANESSALTFNPIYLFGRSGVGKSHLLMAAAIALREKKKRVIYARAETFTEHVVNAIRTGEMQNFRKNYRNTDILIMDDIELFARKGATQEELFHTFNTLHVEGKQIILSANCSPSELKFIEPRLTSRFEWGIVIPLLSLEREKMGEVLVSKSEQMEFSLDIGVKEFLLDTFSSSTKSLVRAFEALVLRTHLNQSLGAPPTLPLNINTTRQYLKDLIQAEEKSILTPTKIIRTVAEHYGIRLDDILSKSQTRENVLPRQIAMHLCRIRLNLPFMKIGELFSRDHSTVISSVKVIQKGLEKKEAEISVPFNSILKILEEYTPTT
ncbi:MAG: ATP-binding protein [Chlamydiia bacterium]|nr:ATP-binding protein [Chlamydiia bacterium]